MTATTTRRQSLSRRGDASRRISSVPRPAGRGEGFEIRPEGVAFGVLDELIGYAIRRAQIRIYEDFLTLTERTGLTPPLFAALVLIEGNPGMQQARLGQVMGVARSGAMALVDRLEERGLVERRPVAGDRRANALALTPRGGEASAEMKALVIEHDARVTARMTDGERRLLKELLAKF